MDEFRLLMILNWSFFAVHAVWTGLVLGISDLWLTSPLYRADYISFPPVLVPYGTIQPSWMTAFFFFTTSFFHVGNAWIWRGLYERRLKMAQAPLRWVEYAISATVMMILIAYASGVRNWDTIVLIGVLTATTMSFGWLNEVICRPNSVLEGEWEKGLLERAQAHVLGWIPMIGAWVVIVVSFVEAAMDLSPPAFVYAIVISQLVLFFSFAGPQMYQVLVSPRRFWHGEVAYQVLSFIAKSVLGGLFLGYVLVVDVNAPSAPP